MNISQLKQAAARQRDLRIHVIRSRESKLYQIECEEEAGQVRLLEERGRPQLFRSLEEAYDLLKQVGVEQAWLVRWEQRHPIETPCINASTDSGLISVAL